MYENKGKSTRNVVAMILMIMMMAGLGLRADAVSGADVGVSKVSFDGYLMGIEDEVYTVDKNGKTLYYKSDGSTYTKDVSGLLPSQRRHMILTDVSSGEEREGYCIEFNTDFHVQTEYKSSGYLTDKVYFANMPEDVKKLMLAVTYYGKNGKNKLPVSGVNGEDYYFATQMVIWEVQQQLRVFTRDSNGRITGTKRVEAHGMQADFFYRALKGRAAEKCYDYIIENINNHFVTPRFIGETAAKAEPILLKYNMQSKTWQASADEGKCDFDMKWSMDSVKYSNSKTSHTFEVSKAIDGEKTIKVKRQTDEGSAAENLLIWNHEGDSHMQVVATGSASPPEFYMRLKTDIPAEVTVEKKDAETGLSIPVAGVQYKIKSLDLDKYVSDGMSNDEGEIYCTDRDGRAVIPVKLQEGKYQLEEVKAPKGYVRAKDPQEFTVDGQTSDITIEQKDVPQKGIITINKIAEYKYKDDWADIREQAMGGIDFDIIALADIITADGTVRAKEGEIVDTVRTDFKGNVSSKELYLGPYNIVEKDAPEEYRIADSINAALVYADQNLEVVDKQINVLNRLKRVVETPEEEPEESPEVPPAKTVKEAPKKVTKEAPETGDDTGINTIILVMLLSLTIMAVTTVMFYIRRHGEK